MNSDNSGSSLFSNGALSNADNPNDFQTFTMPISSNLDTQFKLPQSVGGGKADAPSKTKIKSQLQPDTEDYVKRRSRNNVAVKKSREKSKQKGNDTTEGIERLKLENAELEEKVEYLSKELAVLKKVFMDHTRGFNDDGSKLPDLKQLEILLGHKLADKTSSLVPKKSSDNEPCSSNSGS